MKAMTDAVFEELGCWMQVVTQMFYMFSCKQSKLSSTQILQRFSAELPLINRLAEMLDDA